MAVKERGRAGSGVIRMGTPAKDVEVIGEVGSGSVVESERADEAGIVRMGTPDNPAEVLVKARRIK